MFYHYFITAWRNITKNVLFSSINIFGLVIGLTSCLLILLFVREETGFDTWLKDSDRLVRLHSAFFMPGQAPFLSVRSAGRMMEAVQSYANNEVETAVRLIQHGLTIQHERDVFQEQITMADGSFFDVFELPFLQGSKNLSYNKPFDTVITEDIAIKYFGKTDVIGETLTLCCLGNEPTVLPITGIIKNLPDATHLDLNILIYLQPAIFADNPNMLDTWTSLNVYTYFKMNKGITIDQFQERINYWVNNESPFIDMMKANTGMLSDGKKITDEIKHKLMAVPDLHLHAKTDAGNSGDLTPMGDHKMIVTFTVVAGLVLIIACFNFMNLSTARSGRRAREVAMRKTLGASRAQVAIQFFSETMALVLISLFFSLVAVELILPLYNDILGRNLELHLLQDPALLFYIMVIALSVGIISGLYPALYLSRFLPAQILTASKGGESGGAAKFRTTLVILQFSVSIILAISTIVVYAQTIYSNNIDVGYQSDNKLVLNVSPIRHNDMQSLKQELLNLPEINSVVFSSESPTQDNENKTLFTLIDKNDAEPQNEVLNHHSMDFEFFNAYKVSPIAGRLFNESYTSDQMTPNRNSEEKSGSGSAILNESAVRRFGFTDPQHAIGKTLLTNINAENRRYSLSIIGVIPDIYFRSIKFDIRPSVYLLHPDRFRVANLSFNTNDLPRLMKEIEAVWKKQAPMFPMELQFLSEMMKAQYNDEEIQSRLFSVFSLLAILIACLGLYGLSAFTAERRTKEIGIRKVMGASVRNIVVLLVWQFSKPVIIANLIAWPLAIYAMLTWLENFPYRINTIWLLPICISAGVASLMIAWLTVGTNAAKVAKANPIKSLRYD